MIKFLKKHFHLLVLCFAAAVLIATIAIYGRGFTRKCGFSEQQVVKDSIKFYDRKSELHADSADIFLKDYEKFTQKSDRFDNADSAARQIERASYRAEWERRNGY
jgi:hypothetical protein